MVVSARARRTTSRATSGRPPGTGYFAEEVAARVERRGSRRPGSSTASHPSIVEEVALQAPTQRQTEPGVNLFATDPGADGGLRRDRAGRRRRRVARRSAARRGLPEPEGRGGASASAPATGSSLFAGGQPVSVRVRDVVDYEGAGTADAALLLPLEQAQRLLGREGLIKHVLVSNRGSGASAVALSDQVVAALDAARGDARASRRRREAGRARDRRRGRQRLHGLLHDLRVVLDRRRASCSSSSSS